MAFTHHNWIRDLHPEQRLLHAMIRQCQRDMRTKAHRDSAIDWLQSDTPRHWLSLAGVRKPDDVIERIVSAENE